MSFFNTCLMFLSARCSVRHSLTPGSTSTLVAVLASPCLLEDLPSTSAHLSLRRWANTPAAPHEQHPGVADSFSTGRGLLLPAAARISPLSEVHTDVPLTHQPFPWGDLLPFLKPTNSTRDAGQSGVGEEQQFNFLIERFISYEQAIISCDACLCSASKAGRCLGSFT